MNKVHFAIEPCRTFGLIAALAAAMLLAPAAANATPYVVTFTQQGGNVVANGSGAFDTRGLAFSGVSSGASNWPGIVEPDDGLVSMGVLPDVGIPPGASDVYNFENAGQSKPFFGPANFGSGIGSKDGSVTGDFVLVWSQVGQLDLPVGYTSGTFLSNSAIWDVASFAGLGITPGIYTWTWGTGAEQSFTIDIVAPTVNAPEPAALGMFGLGVLLIGGFAGLRRRLV